MPETLGTPPEGAKMASEEEAQKFEQLTREVEREIIEKIANDPGFKDKMLSDPEAAVQEAGLAEKIEALEGSSDVAGHHYGMTRTVVYRKCIIGTSYYRYHWHGHC